MELTLEEEYLKLQEVEKSTDTEVAKIEKKIRLFNWIGWSSIFLGIAIGILGIYSQLQGTEEVKLSETGDFIGGTVASLWSLSGLFFIYVAFLGQQKQMLIQRQELRFSRYEVKANRMELEGQKKQMVEQSQTFKLQRFENTFFNLLDLHHQIVNNIESQFDEVHKKNGKVVNNQRIVLRGRDVFKNDYPRLLEHIGKNIKNEEELNKKYLHCWYEFQKNFGHYFRNLYRIIKLVDETSFPNSEDFMVRYKYTSMIRAQLSDHELLWLFYNSLSDNGKKFKPLIIKYTLLKNTPRDQIGHQNMYERFPEQAFEPLHYNNIR